MPTISQAAAQIGVSAATLRRWDRKGTFEAYRTAGNHRRYKIAEIRAFLARTFSVKTHKTHSPLKKKDQKKCAIFARVSIYISDCFHRRKGIFKYMIENNNIRH
ncbi:MAG: MerR family DNA-binding transcriptional regulator [Candidatus Lokiarchaeota archaeon]|nr:MerR family DNA-binding transcriptional regulator [Candidatus Lokiarchaeota archaeon]